MKQRFARGANRSSGFASTALKTAGLDRVEQSSLGVRRGLMDACRLVALSNAMVTSAADGPDKAYAMIPPEDGMVEDGGGGS